MNTNQPTPNLSGRRCAFLEKLVEKWAEHDTIVYATVVRQEGTNLVVLHDGREFTLAAKRVHLAEPNGTFKNRVQKYTCPGDKSRDAIYRS